MGKLAKTLKQWNKRARARQDWLKMWEATGSGLSKSAAGFALKQAMAKERRSPADPISHALAGLIDAAMAVAPAPKGLIRAQPTYMCADKGETIFLSEEKYNEVIGLPTPETMWFTPRTGWPSKAREHNRCRDLIPTTAKAPQLIAGLEDDSVGTLYLEVLQAKGLPKFDALSENDIYALVVFEGVAAVTATIQDMDDPRWHSGAARAFKLPVFNPYSVAYIALLDEDETLNPLDLDDPAGRVALEVRAGTARGTRGRHECKGRACVWAPTASSGSRQSDSYHSPPAPVTLPCHPPLSPSPVTLPCRPSVLPSRVASISLSLSLV